MHIVLIALIAAVVITGLVLLVLSLIEPHKLNITEDKLSENAKDGDPDVRLLFFSDLHAEFCFIPQEKLKHLKPVPFIRDLM